MSSLTINGPTSVFHAAEIQLSTAGATSTLAFSDQGYVTEAHVPYPPLVAEAFAIDRRLELSPADQTSDETWGAITLNNPAGVLDTAITTGIVDHMPVQIYAGRKTYDPTRGLLLDPPYASLAPMFGGLVANFEPDLDKVTMALLSVMSWLSKTIPIPAYGGTGGLDGTTDLAGRLKPRIRGYVSNITPILIDPANLVYQVSDSTAIVSDVYEGGFDGGLVGSGSVSDIYASSTAPAPGHYTTQSDGSGTFIRLCTKPVYAITVDASAGPGSAGLPSNTSPSWMLDLVKSCLLIDLAMPAALIDGNWTAYKGIALSDTTGGWFWDGSAVLTGEQLVEDLLAGLGVRLFSTRMGTLRPVVFYAPEAGNAGNIVFTADQIVSVAAVPIDTLLDPPTVRWRLGYGHNFTVQPAGSSVHPQTTAARQSMIALADRTATWSTTSAYPVPNDPALLITALNTARVATNRANDYGALWGVQRRVWAITLPKHLAYAAELGDTISVTAPVPGLRNGVFALVIGEQVRSEDPTSILQILV